LGRTTVLLLLQYAEEANWLLIGLLNIVYRLERNITQQLSSTAGQQRHL
jgi:hypothetical protein